MAPNLKAPCRVCGIIPDPLPSRYKRWDYICNTCFRDYCKRKGYKGGKSTKEWESAYNKRYNARPEVLKHRAEDMRRRYQNPAERFKVLSRKALQWAVISGRVIKKPCSVCGNSPSQAHHENYAEPLRVVWLCRICHTKIHKRRAKGE